MSGKRPYMSRGHYEQVLETLEDLDARLAGLEVGYNETNATAADDLVAQLGQFFESDPEDFVALREAVDRLVENEDSTHAATAKEHADALKDRVEAQIDE
jgi:site-specific recombinase